jgi:uncharacterized protein YjeT (DUF2065 family)
MKNNRLHICLVFVITGLFIITAPVAVRAIDQVELVKAASLNMNNVVSASPIIIGDSVYISIIRTGDVRFYRFLGDRLIDGEKFSLVDSDREIIQTRSPSAGILTTSVPSKRVWLWSNSLRSGAYYDLQPLNPFIRLVGHQPVAAGRYNGEESILFSDFTYGTDLFNGRLRIHSLVSASEAGRAKIAPFYMIRNLAGAEGISSRKWRWMVLHNNDRLHLYDELFSESVSLRITTGCFVVSRLDGEPVIFLTSGHPFSDKMGDAIICVKLNIGEKPSTEEMMAVDLPGTVLSLESFQLDGDHYLCVLRQDGGSSTLDIFRVDY